MFDIKLILAGIAAVVCFVGMGRRFMAYGYSKGFFTGFACAIKEVSDGHIIVKDDGVSFGMDSGLELYDSDTGERVTHLNLEDIERFKSERM